MHAFSRTSDHYAPFNVGGGGCGSGSAMEGGGGGASMVGWGGGDTKTVDRYLWEAGCRALVVREGEVSSTKEITF